MFRGGRRLGVAVSRLKGPVRCERRPAGASLLRQLLAALPVSGIESQPADGDPLITNALAGDRVVSGTRVVLGMALFGLLMTGAMFVYWELYTAPFRPLQTAIAAAFPGSNPQAVGGRYKSHRPDSPAILRMIVRVKWDPREDDARARQMVNELEAIASKQVDPANYDELEIVLMHRRPEKWTISWMVVGPWADFPLPTTGPLPETVKVSVLEGVEGS